MTLDRKSVGNDELIGYYLVGLRVTYVVGFQPITTFRVESNMNKVLDIKSGSARLPPLAVSVKTRSSHCKK